MRLCIYNPIVVCHIARHYRPAAVSGDSYTDPIVSGYGTYLCRRGRVFPSSRVYNKRNLFDLKTEIPFLEIPENLIKFHDLDLNFKTQKVSNEVKIFEKDIWCRSVIRSTQIKPQIDISNVKAPK